MEMALELKPKGKPGTEVPKPLESIGAGGANPWAMLSQHKVGAPMGKRKNWGAASLGATPPRDGPFQEPAAGIAGQMPPKTRTERQAVNPWALLSGRGRKAR